MLDIIKNYKSQILRVLGIIFLLLFVYICFNYSFARISVESTKGTVALFATVDSPIFKKDLVSNKTSLVFLKKGTKLLTIRSGEKEVRLPFNFRPIWSGSYNMNLKPQKKIDKVASSALACGLMNNDQIYNSYRCQGGSDIIRYNTSGSFPINEVFLDKTRVQIVRPQQYLGGILAFTYISPESNAFRLSEITLGESAVQSNINIQSLTRAKSISTSTIGTDITNKSNRAFLIVNNDNNKLYIFKSTDDKKPVEVNLLDGIEKDKTANHECTISNKVISCMYSRLGYDVDQNKESGLDESLKTIITVYDNSGEKLTRRTIKEEGGVDQMLLKSPYLALRTDEDYLIIYNINDSKFKRVGDTTGVEDVIFTEDGNLVTREGGLMYSLSPDNLEAHLIFSSKNLRISRFSSSYDNGYFVGYLNNQNKSSLTAFKILPGDKKGGRVEDNLPTTYSDKILQMDYSNDTLYIKIRLKSYTNNIGSGEFILDEGDFNTKKQYILDEITKSGFSKNFKTIKFSY